MNDAITNKPKPIHSQTEWNAVAPELEHEKLKLMSYDNTLLSQVENWSGKKVLDYGSGPGILAKALQGRGADIKIYDINPEMRAQAGQKIGAKNTYNSINEIPKNSFDLIVCNLVLCIVPEVEAEQIVSNIRTMLRPGGEAYIGFCNPKIYNVAESHLDFRFYSGKSYRENHSYRKIKKEGIYEIVENHRPVEWYAKMFHNSGLVLMDMITTPEYEIRSERISDFVIFKLQKQS